jgi:small neutral amino acid transporter SnatA (MarC family)
LLAAQNDGIHHFHRDAEELAGLTIMLLVVMAINLVALLTVDGVSKYLSVEALEVANRILGLLLAALAVETIINGSAELLRDAVRQLQEMDVIAK